MESTTDIELTLAEMNGLITIIDNFLLNLNGKLTKNIMIENEIVNEF